MDEELRRKSELFDFLIANFHCNIERRINGRRSYTFTTSNNTLCKESREIMDWHQAYSEQRSSRNEYENYLRLKQKFEPDA